jgi:tetratricopeptide (TPR) repeat protein
MAYSATEEYNRAIADLTKAIELDPELASAYAMRGAAYAMKGEAAKAVSDLKKAIELSDDPVVLNMAQDILDLLGR